MGKKCSGTWHLPIPKPHGYWLQLHLTIPALMILSRAWELRGAHNNINVTLYIWFISKSFRDCFKILHMDCDRPNIFLLDKKISKSLRIGYTYLTMICLHICFIIRNINRELAWLLPLISGRRRLKVQIFVLDKDTADLISKY